jgi:SAM-dependent methyltransferase
MMLIDNKGLFATTEFKLWAERQHLTPAEEFLIRTYLNRTAKTLEAGTGAGRILLEMKALGFKDLHGFDLVHSLIVRAKTKHYSNGISFEVHDATSLGYKTSTFDQVIYLQQVICFIEDAALRLAALKEAYRVLKPGGIALFSFLAFESRIRRIAYIPLLAYLWLIRQLNRTEQSIQYLPWLRRGDTFNWGSLIDARPYVYWYRAREICELLEQAGFQIKALGSDPQIEKGMLRDHCGLSARERGIVRGMLYLVCER